MVPFNTPSFYSAFASRLYDFIKSKRRDGYKYNREVKALQQFDRYLLSNELSPDSCNGETVFLWLAKRTSESDKSFSLRNCIYRQLYKFLTMSGDHSLPAPPNAREKIMRSGFTPYIFTHDEVGRLFAACDTETETAINAKCVVFRRCAPLLFRILYGTGLRVNEALSLTANDVKLDQKLLVIREAKNDNSRLVPVSDSLLRRLESYVGNNDYTGNTYIFKNEHNHHLAVGTVYHWFRLILWRAGMHHGGRGKGPRMHDLRHTFAVHSLQAAIRSGMDPNVFLPLLCVYLGHATLSSTERYLRLTAEAFPSVQQEMNKIMSAVIPEVTRYA